MFRHSFHLLHWSGSISLVILELWLGHVSLSYSNLLHFQQVTTIRGGGEGVVYVGSDGGGLLMRVRRREDEETSH